MDTGNIGVDRSAMVGNDVSVHVAESVRRQTLRVAGRGHVRDGLGWHQAALPIRRRVCCAMTRSSSVGTIHADVLLLCLVMGHPSDR